MEVEFSTHISFFGDDFQSNGMKTIGNANPFDLCIVINLTAFTSSEITIDFLLIISDQ